MTRLTARTRALAATALIALTPTIASAAPIVTNGDFEAGTLTGWTAGSLVTANNSFSNDGSWAARMGCQGDTCVSIDASGVGGDGILRQVLSLQPGVYRLSYAHRIDGGTFNKFAVSLGSNVLSTPTVDAAAHGFLPETAVSAVAGGSTALTFAVRNDPSYDRIDSVILTMIDDGAGNNIGAVAQASAFQNTYGFLDRLQDRFGHAGSPVKVALNTPVETASSTGAYVSPTGKYRAYMSGYGDRSRWDGGDERGQRWGLTAGIEMGVTPGLDVGAVVSAGQSRFSSDTVFTDNRGRADEYAGAIYGHFSPASMPLFITAAAGYGYTSTNLTRTSIAGDGTAMALDVGTTQWFGSVELGYDWALSNGFVLTPFARADGARLNQDGYDEFILIGGTLLPMSVASVDQDAARTILGARGTIDLNVGRRGAKLTASAGWDHEFERDRAVAFSTTSFTNGAGGTDVTFSGVAAAASPAANSVVAGAGVEAPITDDARIFVGYNGNFASGQNNHAGEVGLRVNW